MSVGMHMNKEVWCYFPDFNKRMSILFAVTLLTSFVLFGLAGAGVWGQVACQALSGLSSITLMFVAAAAVLVLGATVMFAATVYRKAVFLLSPFGRFAEFSVLLPAAVAAVLAYPFSLSEMWWHYISVLAGAYIISFLQWLWVNFIFFMLHTPLNPAARTGISVISLLMVYSAVVDFIPTQNWRAISQTVPLC